MLYDEALSVYLTTLIVKEYSPATIYNYRQQLTMCRQFLKTRHPQQILLDAISINDLEQYMVYLAHERKLQPSSRNCYLSSVFCFFQFSLKKDWISRNPALFIDSARVHDTLKKTLSEIEIAELVDTIKHPVIRMAIELMTRTGLRCGEATTLQLDHLDLVHNELHVVNGKGGKYRIIPISASLHNLLLLYLDHIRHSESNYVLATKKTGRLSPSYINEHLEKAASQLQWQKKITNHTLRRSFATNLYRKGISLAAIQELLGHDNVRTTSLYVNAQDSELREAVNLL